jgi:hypothetical protein
VTNAKLEETLGRLSVLKWFPTNLYAITAIGEILRELCPTDGDATELAREVLKSFDEWCGPQSLRKARAEILEGKLAKENERKLKAAYVAAGADRKAHEDTCTGYSIELDHEARTVSVRPCREGFGTADMKIWHWLRCRKGDALAPQVLRQVLEAELAKRPDWVSVEAYYAQRVREGRRELAAESMAGKRRSDHDGTGK